MENPDCIMAWIQTYIFVLNPAVEIFILFGLVAKYVRASTLVPLSVQWYVAHMIAQRRNDGRNATATIFILFAFFNCCGSDNMQWHLHSKLYCRLVCSINDHSFNRVGRINSTFSLSLSLYIFFMQNVKHLLLLICSVVWRRNHMYCHLTLCACVCVRACVWSSTESKFSCFQKLYANSLKCWKNSYYSQSDSFTLKRILDASKSNEEKNTVECHRQR